MYPIVDSLLTYSEFIRDICVPAFSNDGMPNIDWERISVEDKQVLLNCLEEKGVIIYLDSSKVIPITFNCVGNHAEVSRTPICATIS